MARRPSYTPLRVFLNNAFVGLLEKEPSGAVSFQYSSEWLNCRNAIPVSLSLPLREEVFRGAPAQAVFENLLPDSEPLRRMVAEKVGADGTDSFSLLTQIGRDCVGALQFAPEGVELSPGKLEGEVVNELQIEAMLNGLVKAPLGMDGQSEFRISLAGAQEKTALLRLRKNWIKPHGATPTSHIFKAPMGTLPNGMDLSNSVENEYYCLKLLGAFGLPVTEAEIMRFGKRRVLAVTRFDRKWIGSDQLLRLPQEDCCQALGVPPSRKYQSQGGPGMVDILDLLKGTDTPREDQITFLKAHILFWLIGATDGHAKNFSVFLGPGGTFGLTPLYDVLSAQPSFKRRQIERKHLKLAMFVGENRHYRLDEIERRHFVQTAKRARISESLVATAFEEIEDAVDAAIENVELELPADFPEEIHASVTKGLVERLKKI